MKKAVLILTALLVFGSDVFAEELTAEELYIYSTEKYPFVNDKFRKRAKEISHDVAGIDEKFIRSEYLSADARLLKRAVNVSTWSTFGFFVGYIPGIVVTFATIPKTQKIMLRKEMLFQRLVPVKQVSDGGSGVNMIGEFGKSGKRFSDDEIVFGF